MGFLRGQNLTKILCFTLRPISLDLSPLLPTKVPCVP